MGRHKDCRYGHQEYGDALFLEDGDRKTTVSFDSHTNLGPEHKRDIEPTFFFMLNCLLYSRLETGNPSNQGFYDEDVNMYLTNLLCSFMKPEYHHRANSDCAYDNTFQAGADWRRRGSSSPAYRRPR